MKNAALILVLAIVLIGLICFGALGLRSWMLREINCSACRGFYSLFFQPDDFNAPIAIAQIEQGRATFHLFPNYVGPYFVRVFKVNSINELLIKQLTCSDEVHFRSAVGTNAINRVFSDFGNGFILGSISISRDLAGARTRPVCEVVFTSAAEGQLVISRASEL
ncbi:MAG: hypothetical protein ACT4NL_12835 [Pseudomarimonas sp.]